MLTNKEEHKYNVISQLVKGSITRKEASYELDLSLKQIDRLRKKFEIQGKEGFIHKNRGKTPVNKMDINVLGKIEDLYLTEFYDYNFEHFYDEIKDEYDISYSSLYRYFLKNEIISPIAHKETIKLYNEAMINAIENKENIKVEKVELYYSRKIFYEQAHTRRSSNLHCFGQEVQMDGCFKKWFGNIVTCLHLAVDKGTKKVLAGWFEYQETTRGYFVLFFLMIINYGIPKRVKTDNRTSFSNQENNVDTTQIGNICKMLGIELVTTSIPQGKPNVERENGVFKNRLMSELRHEKITDIDEANKYLNEVFIPKMNKKFSYEIDEKTSMMKPNEYSEEELNLIISEKFTRIIDNASSIKYNNKYYVPVDVITGEVVTFMRKTECTVLETYNAEYWCEIEQQYYKLIELENRDTTMKKEIDNDKPIEKKKYIPPKDHPWRKNMMLSKYK